VATRLIAAKGGARPVRAGGEQAEMGYGSDPPSRCKLQIARLNPETIATPAPLSPTPDLGGTHLAGRAVFCGGQKRVPQKGHSLDETMAGGKTKSLKKDVGEGKKLVPHPSSCSLSYAT